MTKHETEDTLTVLPIGEDPLEMTERNKDISISKNEHKTEPNKKRPKRKRIPK